MRITDQYFWHVIFLIFFFCLVFLGAVVLQSEAYKPYNTLTFFDMSIMTLATMRVIRFVVHDRMTAFFREQFYNMAEYKGKFALVKPTEGPRRAFVDLITCPWSVGMCAGAVIIFAYMSTPYTFFPILILALSGVASILQLYANLLGLRVEQAKIDADIQ